MESFYTIEISVRTINKINKTKLQRKVIDFVESKVSDKLQAFDRRSRLRKIVEYA